MILKNVQHFVVQMKINVQYFLQNIMILKIKIYYIAKKVLAYHENALYHIVVYQEDVANKKNVKIKIII